jgi:hypothetical protein
MTPTGSAKTSAAPAQKVRRMPKRKRMNREEERIAFLQNDDDVESFTYSEAICSACGTTIKSDTRDGARFYVSDWLRHKACCMKIEERNGMFVAETSKRIFLMSHLQKQEADRKVQLRINEGRSGKVPLGPVRNWC